MAKQDKIIAFFLIFQAVVGAATFAWLAGRTQLPVSTWALFTPLIAAALVAGIGSLRRHRWAALLGLIVFAVQTPIIATPYMSFYAWLGVHLDVAATWQGQARLGVNLVGLGMLIWASIRYSASNKSRRNEARRTSNEGDYQQQDA